MQQDPTMDATDRSPGGSARRVMRLIVAAGLVVASVIGAWQTQRLLAEREQARFDREVARIEFAIQQRMTAYIQVLRGGLGLFQISDSVDREEWQRYVALLQLGERYPGFKALSFAAAVKTEDLPAFIARVRAEPLPPGLSNPALMREYQLRAPNGASGDPSIHAPVLYVAPMIPENERALGVDLMQEPGRRAAMEQAAQSGNTVLSPRLKLTSQTDSKAGFAAYLAVQRDGALLGWLAAVFRADNFMHGLLGHSATVLDFEVYDGAQPLPEALLYSTVGIESDGSPQPLPATSDTTFTRVRQIELPGRQWTLHYRAVPGFVPVSDRIAPWLVLAAGLLASLLFYAAERSGARLRTAREQMAEQNRQLQVEIWVREQAEAELRRQATHDALTGLANRGLFMESLQAALERSRRLGQRFALAYVDLDDFRSVNDRHGHQIGDALLAAVAGRLQAPLSKDDTAARLSGDEFAIVLEQPFESAAAVQAFCAGIVRSLSQPFALTTPGGPLSVAVSASAGVSVFPLNGEHFDALIIAADRAMERAKREGKNRCVLASEPGG